MSIDTRIVDGFGSGLSAHLHRLPRDNSKHVGQLVLTEPFVQLNPEVHPFLNSSFGVAMNQNIAFGGTPEIINNGDTSDEWIGTILAGNWDFADAGKTSITTANNNDAATFSSTYEIDMTGFTSITGKVNLTVYNPVNNTIVMIFDLAGVPTGNSINLNDFINPGLTGTEQNFVIPKADFGLDNGEIVDGFTITLTRTGGARPTMTFDDIQIEETGTPAVFKADTPEGTIFHITELRISIADNITGTQSDGVVPALSYDQLLGLSSLTNGIVFQRVQKGIVNFSVILKQLSDFLKGGSNIANIISDGSNTYMVLQVDFPEPIVLVGGTDSFLSFTISDNLSDLLVLEAVARGSLEEPIP